MTRSSLLRITTVALITLAFGTLPVLAQSDLNGAWRITAASGNDSDGDWKVETVQPSLYIFTDGYYSIMRINGDEPRPLMPDGTGWSNMSLEQMRSLCSGAVFTANSGTYEVDGLSLTTTPIVAKSSNYMDGGSRTDMYRIEGRMLTLSNEGDDFSYKITLERLD